ncbi:21004_t:CDS:1 [Racocetra persica]|uniref:21004_t:CDS:1 n=1 Tax=Racocetra persica TaxID=160502 RepID=A0ACA9NJG6_9GLOM|nr:21004_t:CDS:1 [Racocetra persica]
MKFLSILTLALVLIIAVAHASPVDKAKESPKIGPKVGVLGVRFQDSYEQYTQAVQASYGPFQHKVDSFKAAVTEAAKVDHTDKKAVQWLVGWNDKYNEKVNELKKTTGELNELVAQLKEKLADFQ